MLKKQNTVFLTESALIAALYAVLTYVSAAMNLAFGVVQFRFAEALTVLPIFTPAAIPGLTVGCIISNLASPLGVADWIFGPVATLLASLLTRKLKDIKLLGIPFLSILMPVIFNAVIIGFEISLIGDGGAFSLSFVNMSLFVSNALSVALGEGLVLIVLGIPLIILLNKSKLLKRIKKS